MDDRQKKPKVPERKDQGGPMKSMKSGAIKAAPIAKKDETPRSHPKLVRTKGQGKQVAYEESDVEAESVANTESTTHILDIPDDDLEQVLSMVNVEYWYTTVSRVCDKWKTFVETKMCPYYIRGLCLGDRYFQILFHAEPGFCQQPENLCEYPVKNRSSVVVGKQWPHRHKLDEDDDDEKAICQSLLMDANPRLDDDFYNYVLEWGTVPNSRQRLCLFLATHSGQKFQSLHLAFEKFHPRQHKDFTMALLERVQKKCENLASLQFDRSFFRLEQVAVMRFNKLLPKMKKLKEFIAVNGNDDEEELTNAQVQQMSQSASQIMNNSSGELENLVLENINVDKSSIDQMSNMQLKRFCFRLSCRGHEMIPYLVEHFFTKSMLELKEVKLSFLLLKEYQTSLDSALRHFQGFAFLESLALGYQEGKASANAKMFGEALKNGFRKLRHLAFESIQYEQLIENDKDTEFLNNIAETLEFLEIGGFLGDLEICGNLLWAVSDKITIPNLHSFRVNGRMLVEKGKIIDFVAKHCPNLENLFYFDVSRPKFLPFVEKLLDKMFGVRKRFLKLKLNRNLKITVSRPYIPDTDNQLKTFTKEGVVITLNNENVKALITRYWLEDA